MAELDPVAVSDAHADRIVDFVIDEMELQWQSPTRSEVSRRDRPRHHLHYMPSRSRSIRLLRRCERRMEQARPDGPRSPQRERK